MNNRGPLALTAVHRGPLPRAAYLPLRAAARPASSRCDRALTGPPIAREARQPMRRPTPLAHAALPAATTPFAIASPHATSEDPSQAPPAETNRTPSHNSRRTPHPHARAAPRCRTAGTARTQSAPSTPPIHTATQMQSRLCSRPAPHKHSPVSHPNMALPSERARHMPTCRRS